MSPRVGLLVRLSALLVLASAATAAGQDRRVVSAAANQDAAAVRVLLADGVDVNARRADGATALLWAAHKDALEMVDLLLRAGADVNAPTNDGTSPLALAVINAHFELANLLLDGIHGVDVRDLELRSVIQVQLQNRAGGNHENSKVCVIFF